MANRNKGCHNASTSQISQNRPFLLASLANIPMANKICTTNHSIVSYAIDLSTFRLVKDLHPVVLLHLEIGHKRSDVLREGHEPVEEIANVKET